MPSDIKGIATKTGDSYINTLTWTVALGDTIYLVDFPYSNPAHNVGLATFFIDTVDTGGGTPTITPTLQFKFDTDVYGVEHSLHDDNANTSFTSGGKFECSLNKESWWKWHISWRIKLVRNSSSLLTISYAYGATL